MSSRTSMDKKAGALLDGCHCKGCIDGDSIIRAASRQRRSERGEFVHHLGALALSGGALSRLQPLSYSWPGERCMRKSCVFLISRFWAFSTVPCLVGLLCSFVPVRTPHGLV